MYSSKIREESLSFVRVADVGKFPAVTCSPEMGVVEMARLMRQHDASGLVVVEGDAPIGVVSVRECRDLIAEEATAIAGRRVRDIMSPAVVTIGRDDYVFTAIFKMAKHNLYRLVVLDPEGRLAGTVTATDILRLQTRTPLYFLQEIEGAGSIDELQLISARIVDMVRFATWAGADTKSLVQLISHFNDAATLRVIYLLEKKEGIRLPAGATYLALGSEGRGEQTLRTDQDSAMVYVDDLPLAELPRLEEFAVRLADALDAIGLPHCPGNTMARNPLWRRSLSEWKQTLDQWITVPIPDNLVNFGMFQNLRALHGDLRLEKELQDHILASVQRHSLFLVHMARHVVRFQPPLGWFGRIKVTRRGEHRGKVDLKRAGIFAFTLGASLLALDEGIIGGSTWEKIEELGRRGVISPGDLEAIDESFTFLVQMQLQRQLRDLASDRPPTNQVDPLVMTDKVRDQFREALQGVATLLRVINERYQLDLISK
ncbi:MAG: CBS domain-containing protein [Desulfuromonadales bacterium]|nr:CBS domain-containing protein [Desulfuromonadales bacterium]